MMLGLAFVRGDLLRLPGVTPYPSARLSEELATKLAQPHVLALVTGQDPQSAKVENLLFDPG